MPEARHSRRERSTRKMPFLTAMLMFLVITLLVAFSTKVIAAFTTKVMAVY